ncbi:MAG: HAD family hydrolase [Verrucomicrobiae bacterium]|nr:HAD family hydrolase [Verrucomicrobiae bacterium]
MKIKAIIFDIYKTLLDVIFHSPEQQEELWQELYTRFFNKKPFVSFQFFSQECDRLIGWHHEQLKNRGIIFPEVNWEEIVKLALPEVVNLRDDEFDEFIFLQSRVWHSVNMCSDAIDFLKFAKGNGIALGIASNCQNYTLREMQDALEKHGMSMNIFKSDLCFYSFKYGFSKPDPHVFCILTTMFEREDIKPHEILMVGDSIENDIIPARRFGWGWWLLSDSRLDLYENSGNWGMLKSKIQEG